MGVQGEGLIKALQRYRRLTRVPRAGATRRIWLTAYENRRSGRGLLRDGLRASTQYEQIMTQLAASHEGLPIRMMRHPQQSHQSLATGMLHLLELLDRYEEAWIERHPVTRQTGGNEYWYRLLPQGRAVMACKEEDR